MYLASEVQKPSNAPVTGQTFGYKGQQIQRHSPVCPRGQPPGMAADKSIRDRSLLMAWWGEESFLEGSLEL